MVKGNEVADFGAGAATKSHPEHRNWAQSPMEGVDRAYFTCSDESQPENERDVHFMDMAPHTWVKEHTQKRILRQQAASKRARSRHMALMHMVEEEILCGR